MAFDDTNCPCGDSKERETMLCQQCAGYFGHTVEMAAVNNLQWPVEARRASAIRLLAMSRRRKTDIPPHGKSGTTRVVGDFTIQPSNF